MKFLSRIVAVAALLALGASGAFAASSMVFSTGTQFTPLGPALFQGEDLNVMVSAVNTLRNQADGTTPNTGNVVKSTSATICGSFGPNGSTTPAFNIDCSAASLVDGLNVAGAASGGPVAVSTIGAGNPGLTLNANGSGTIAIGSVSTGAVTITPATTVTGALTPTGGVAAAGGFALAPRNQAACSEAATTTTPGTNTTPVAGTAYISEVTIPGNMTITGLATFNGTVANGNIEVGLFNNAGTLLAHSASTAMSGTAGYQLVAFTAPYPAVGPASYYVATMVDGTTARLVTMPVGNCGTTSQAGTFGSGFAAIMTPPTTFTTNVGIVASLY